ncbi:MAG: nucleoside hydrolase [Brevundimonas sp.]|nr:nucleoside hydrolase [Brevundimonas sp.]
MIAQTTDRLVILDTDPGVDDAMAMLYLAASDQVRLHSVTTVFGNGSEEQTTPNAQYIVDRFGLDVPVFSGADKPLQGERHVPELKVHGNDGLGDTGLSATCKAATEEKPAWQHICDTVLANKGRVTLLAIAPLSNLALALRHRPEIAEHVEQVVVMGGAFGTKGRSGNIRPYAEANFFYDAEAASAVLSAGWPLTVVGLDVTSDCILYADQTERLAVTGGDAGAFIRQISHGYEEIYRKFDGIDGFCIHDVAAAAYVLAPHLFKRVAATFAVGLTADSLGASTALTGAMPPTVCEGGYCIEVDGQRLVADFLRSIPSINVGVEQRARRPSLA